MRATRETRSLLLPRAREPAKARELAAKPGQVSARKFGRQARQTWSAGQARRQPGRHTWEPAGQTAWHLLRQIGELLRARHAATEAHHIAKRGQRAALGATHRLHHVGHGAVHLEQPVDVLDLGSRTGRDALLAARLE